MDVDLASWWPLASQLGVGLVAGFAAGYALKKVGKLLAVAIGLLFVVVQVLAWQGFLTVNWGEVEARVDPLLEVDSLESGWRALVDVLTYNLAFAGAFVPGLILGIRRG
ncbi:MAG: FUN14 domain-containing protein [Trueperaceae bacterium]|nr:FUN14 domain-containing protein [Trueperaceae bacterium]